MSPETRAHAAVMLFAAYAVALGVVLALPRRRRDPHDGMAVGCLAFAAVSCGFAAVLAFAAPRLGWPWVGSRLFELAVVPLVLGAGGGSTALVRRARRRR